MNYAKFLIQQNEQGKYFFRFFTDKKATLLKGFSCDNRKACINTIRELYDTVQKDHHYRFQTAGGKFYFEVTDNTHSVIAVSKLYRTMGGMGFAVDALKRNMLVAVIEDRLPATVMATVHAHTKPHLAK